MLGSVAGTITPFYDLFYLIMCCAQILTWLTLFKNASDLSYDNDG